jgi:hypothetical protein
VPERWELVRYNAGHFETWDMRARITRFLRHFLADAETDPQPGLLPARERK